VNEEYYIQHFTPRRARSIWSKLNLGRAEKLISQGLMNPAGLAEYDKALKIPGRVYDIQKDKEPEIPEDLQIALKCNQAAYNNFMNFSVSNRRMYIFWLNSAKRAETRISRIAKIVENSAGNIRPGMM